MTSWFLPFILFMTHNWAMPEYFIVITLQVRGIGCTCQNLVNNMADLDDILISAQRFRPWKLFKYYGMWRINLWHPDKSKYNFIWCINIKLLLDKILYILLNFKVFFFIILKQMQSRKCVISNRCL